jgi:hypothetical protein
LPHITVTYGDNNNLFTNVINDSHKGSGIITYTSRYPDVATVSNTGVVTILKAGSTIITADKAPDAEYAHATRYYTLEIQPRTLTWATIGTVNGKIYDSTTSAIVHIQPTFTGVILDDNVTPVNGEAAFTDKHVGTGKTVTFSGYSLGGLHAGNYVLDGQPASTTANITPLELTWTVTGTVNNKIYSGTTNATIATQPILSGLLPGDAVILANGTAQFADKNAGIGKTVTFSGYTLVGADRDNYTLPQPGNTTATITPLQLIIYPPIITTTKEADGTPNVVPAPTPGALSNIIYGDTVIVTIDSALYAGSNIGDHLITIVYAINGIDAQNYIKPVDFTSPGRIVAKMPIITWPPAQTTNFEQTQTLANVPIIGGTGAGTFVWTTPANPVGNIGTHSHNMTFIPNDLTEYEPVTGYVNVIVKGPQPVINITFEQIVNPTLGWTNHSGGLTVSVSGDPLRISMSSPAQYASIEWFLNGVLTPGTPLTLQALFQFEPTAVDIGTHTLMVRVRSNIDGMLYSRTIRFTVVP